MRSSVKVREARCMAKIVIRDDCLIPDRYIRMKYQGPDPWGVAEKITDSLRGIY